MSGLTALRTYAAKSNPASLPSSIYFSHTETTLTLFDIYPKSNSFHFLLLPRITSSLSAQHSASLKALLSWNKVKARECLEALAKDAENTKNLIKEEMVKRYGFQWPVFTGFHAVRDVSSSSYFLLLLWLTEKKLEASMEHLHLHIIASDLFSDRLKNKKHYNSFHPKHGFFLHLDDVLSWFDAPPEFYNRMAKLDKVKYEPILKEDLVCWRCDNFFKTMPSLKEHLRKEWEEDAAKSKNRKRKGDAGEEPEDAGPSKQTTISMD